MTQLYYVQDRRSFVGNSVVWWCPNRKGYTTHIDQAGKYTLDEFANSRETDVLWPCEVVDRLWSQHVDMQHLYEHESRSLDRDRRHALLSPPKSEPLVYQGWVPGESGPVRGRWWFRTECDGEEGPYESEAQARAECARYCDHLEGRISPPEWAD